MFESIADPVPDHRAIIHNLPGTKCCPLSEDRTTFRSFEPGKGHVPILLRAALLQRLLMTVTRLHDTDRDTDSLPVAFALMDA